jgi:uncharacterized protein DUF5658
MSRRFAAVLVAMLVSAAPVSIGSAYAQSAATASIADAVAAATTPQFAADQSVVSTPRVTPRTEVTWTTPVLASLQAGLVATQLLDAHSTFRALDAGAVEGNPMMGGLVKNRAAFLGVKAAIGASLVYATHRIGQHNKVTAIALAAAVNSAYAMIASHNYNVARSLQ